MTRKDYILIAGALRDAYFTEILGGGGRCGVESIAEYIADVLAGDNIRFDRTHFMDVVRGDKELHSRP